jgi:hypothetical protein
MGGPTQQDGIEETVFRLEAPWLTLNKRGYANDLPHPFIYHANGSLHQGITISKIRPQPKIDVMFSHKVSNL